MKKSMRRRVENKDFFFFFLFLLFLFVYFKFGMPLRHLNSNMKSAFKYMSLQGRGEAPSFFFFSSFFYHVLRQSFNSYRDTHDSGNIIYAPLRNGLISMT